jgi:hypothetical protein
MKIRFIAALIGCAFAIAACRAEAQTVTLFGNQIPGTPIVSDTGSVTLGVRFYSTQAGTIAGVRFYRGRQASANYVARLYTASGTMLGSVTVSRSAGTGWLTGTFASPISIKANTTYVAAYFSPGGRYAADNNGLINGDTSGPLVAPASGAVGGNGVYCYGSSFCFPTQTYQATNYWVDINFTSTAPSLMLSFTPPNPSLPATSAGGTVVAGISATWSNGQQFTGTLGFSQPYSNDAGTFAISGANLIIDPAGPGVSADGGTTQNVTILAVQ